MEIDFGDPVIRTDRLVIEKLIEQKLKNEEELKKLNETLEEKQSKLTQALVKNEETLRQSQKTQQDTATLQEEKNKIKTELDQIKKEKENLAKIGQKRENMIMYEYFATVIYYISEMWMFNREKIKHIQYVWNRAGEIDNALQNLIQTEFSKFDQNEINKLKKLMEFSRLEEIMGGKRSALLFSTLQEKRLGGTSVLNNVLSLQNSSKQEFSINEIYPLMYLESTDKENDIKIKTMLNEKFPLLSKNFSSIWFDANDQYDPIITLSAG